ncbi:MAG: DUF4230 domain-containing protein [Treponemataceae bacterium]
MKKIMQKIVSFFIGLIVLAGAGYAAYFYGKQYYTQWLDDKFETKIALISEEIQKVAELSTVKINYSDLISIKKEALFGFAKSYSIVKYSGILRIGIENIGLAQITGDRLNSQISITVPSVRVLSNSIESQEIFDEGQNIFVPITTSEIFNEIDKGRNEYVAKILETGIMQEAEQQAEQILRMMFSASGFENIFIHFSGDSNTLQ